MKTDDLVNLLASGVGPVKRHAAARRYAVAVGVGVAAAVLLMLALLGVRNDLVEAIRLPMFWVKLAYAAGLAAASLLAVLRLSRPGERLDGLPALLAAPVLGMWGSGCHRAGRRGAGAAVGVAAWVHLGVMPVSHRHAVRADVRRCPVGHAGTWTDASAPCRHGGGSPLRGHWSTGLLPALSRNGGAVHRFLVPARHADPCCNRRLAG
jgi:hypothetical protein